MLRNRRAMAWIAGYTVHTWELAVLRGWAVMLLAASTARLGAPPWLPAPTVLFTFASLVGIAVSVTGNEISQKHGRGSVVLWAMLAAVVAWNAAIYLDSSALTAGTVQAADQRLRSATMGLHSMAGYAGGFLGPLGAGLALDLAGREGVLGWELAFGQLAVVTLAGSRCSGG